MDTDWTNSKIFSKSKFYTQRVVTEKRKKIQTYDVDDDDEMKPLG